MNFEFTDNGWDDFQFWIETDNDVVLKITDLLQEIKKTPFKGTGKPEPLRYDLKGFWSRRITGEHRLVYKVEGKKGLIRNVSSFNVASTTIKFSHNSISCFVK